ncbi:S-layer homology domain-containing protein [Lysinibacillus sp. NPDC097287]|uniref:S-layer homology domain-containing protein n=1 Tax=Lysinibacillus sp. NPDC097287 TaxID=3364144 RepID=UPI00380E64E6
MKKTIQMAAMVVVLGTASSTPMQTYAYQEPTNYVHTKTDNMIVYSKYGAKISASEKDGKFSVKADIVNNRQPLEVEIFKNGHTGVLKQVTKKTVEPVAYRDEGDRVIATIHGNAELQFVHPTVNNFRDIANSSNAMYITALAERGIVNGRTPDYFGENETLTRAQVSALVARAFSLQQVSTTQFKDIDTKKSWYGGYVGAITSIEVMKGKTYNEFNPNGKLTRQQAILILGRMLDAVDFAPNEEVDGFPYSDSVNFDDELYQHTATLYALGAIDYDEILEPAQRITRGQFAKMLYKVLQESGRL